jgi:dihydropteroate synthase
MGVVNVTPDSFSDGGQYFSTDQAVAQAVQLVQDGADLLDIGGESTRPGAVEISAQEEIDRVLPVIEKLKREVPVPLSIDTWKSEVARHALAAGAEVVNDVSAGRWDDSLWSVVVEAQCGYVLMHAQGRPATMQVQPEYSDVVRDVGEFLRERLAALEESGLGRTHVAVDPGIGFGKSVEHNLALLHQMEEWSIPGCPSVCGVSRKSFLKKIAGEDFLEVSTQVAQAWAAARAFGPLVWRVHDVRMAAASARMVEALRNQNR